MSNKPSIIKDSLKIRNYLKERFRELELTALAIVDDANKRGIKITNGSLSKYLKHGNVSGSLSEENIIWLCIRYGIPINLFIGKPILKDKRVDFVLPPYSEEQCIVNLQKYNFHETRKV